MHVHIARQVVAFFGRLGLCVTRQLHKRAGLEYHIAQLDAPYYIRPVSRDQ